MAGASERGGPNAPLKTAQASARRWAFLALLAGATGIGFAPIFVRLSETGPTATAFFRLLFALPLLWAWEGWEVARRPETAQPRGRRDFFWLGLAGVLFTADLSTWHWSLQFTTVTNSTLITNVAPLFVTLGAWVFLGEPIRARFMAGMGVALLGVGLLAGTSYTLSARHLLGDGLSVVSAVFYAGYLLAMKRLRQSFSTPVTMAWAGLVSCAGFGVVAWLSGDVLLPVTTRGWVVLLALALVSHVGGQTLIAYGFGYLPASFSSVSLLWQPVVAAAVAWIVLGEPVRLVQGAGAMIVLAGIAVASEIQIRPRQGAGRPSGLP